MPGGLPPNNAKQFGLSKQAAYMNNTGPRIINKGATRSEMARTLEAAKHMKGCSCSKCKMAASKVVKKMWTKKKGGK